MRDGVTLAANLTRSSDSSAPRPAILTFSPYHKDGRGAVAADPIHAYFARSGYAALNVDIRGVGGSDGDYGGPFDPQEGIDGWDAVEWVADQSWCSGAVGIWGESYGGIMSQRVAAEQPPHLRAIVSYLACTDLSRDFVNMPTAEGGFWSSATGLREWRCPT